MNAIRPLVSLTLLVLLVGCAALGLEPAGSFNDRVGYATAGVTAALQTTTDDLNAARISSDEATDIAELADQVRDAIGSARTVYAAGQVEEAERRLSLATAILRELQRYSR